MTSCWISLVIHVAIVTVCTIALHGPNCKHFTLYEANGPYIALDVCNQYQFVEKNGGINRGSYKHQCNGDKIAVLYWTNSDRCDGEHSFYTDSETSSHRQCEGDICDHVAFKSYQQTYPMQDLCIDEDQRLYFIEVALVTQCWNVKQLTSDQENAVASSWSVSCDATSFTVNSFASTNCHGGVQRNMYFESGCHWFENGTLSWSFMLPFVNRTVSFTGNNTYIEITSCGGGLDLTWVFVVAPIILFCCFCCIVVVYLRHRRAQKRDFSQSLMNVQRAAHGK